MQQRLCGREQEFGMKVLPAFNRRSDVNRPGMARHSEAALDPGSEFDNWRFAIVAKVIREIGRRQCYSEEFGDYYYQYPVVWLVNGGRVYIDQSNLELACAEGLAGSFDGVLQEKSSELIISEAAESVARSGFEELSFYKNNAGPVDEENFFIEVSYGSHHNYSYRIESQPMIFYLLSNFIPAALPFSGNGHIYRTQAGRFIYTLSERAPSISLVDGLIRSSQTTGNRRPLLNDRDEPFMHSSSGLKRLHLISRDATRCELQTWLVDTMTHFILRLAEEGWKLPFCYRIADPIAELHQINECFEQGLRHQIECLGKGRDFMRVDLWDYNQLFLDHAKQLNPLSEMENKALEEWGRVLALLRAGALDELVGELDWVTKHFVVSGKMKQAGFGWDDVSAYLLCREYHNISPLPEKSLFALLEQEGFIRHLVSKEEVEQAKFLAPATRARSRGEFIKMLRHPKLREQVQSISWEGAYLKKKSDPNPTAEEMMDLERRAYYPYGNPQVWFGEADNPFSVQSSTLDDLYRKLGLSPAV